MNVEIVNTILYSTICLR